MMSWWKSTNNSMLNTWTLKLKLLNGISAIIYFVTAAFRTVTLQNVSSEEEIKLLKTETGGPRAMQIGCRCSMHIIYLMTMRCGVKLSKLNSPACWCVITPACQYHRCNGTKYLHDQYTSALRAS